MDNAANICFEEPVAGRGRGRIGVWQSFGKASGKAQFAAGGSGNAHRAAEYSVVTKGYQERTDRR